MNEDTGAQIANLERKIDAIYVSVEKTRKYFRMTLWITIILFVLPLLAMLFVIPAFLNTYLGSMGAGATPQTDLLNGI